jgi:type I restriction enzyme, R subunit
VNEADTCRKYVVPKLTEAGWDDAPHFIGEQRNFTDGRVILAGDTVTRGKRKRADYLLQYTRDFALAVVEAKADYKAPSDGLQQAKDYAETLGLQFAYATNGHGIVEFDYTTGRETELAAFPGPDELLTRIKSSQDLDDVQTDRLLTPYNLQSGRTPRYYQSVAIHRTIQAILTGKKRVLLTMATGTGKTTTAFQICWKLWSCRWNLTGEHRRPKILYLADRNVLVDDPLIKDFAPFNEAAFKIAQGKAVKSRDIYFAIYQAIAGEEGYEGLYKEFSPDFFDLVIVDECHRGSARVDSCWRDILTYFAPATQVGMTATPMRKETRDTYAYFGNPVYTYSLRQGIEDGFLAPYRLRRIVTTVDATGWRPNKGEVDRHGREIPDDEYRTKDFERVVALRARTKAIAQHLTAFLKTTDRFSKTIVFCVDQEHADEMRKAINNLNTDLTRQYPNYVCRVTADEGQIGRGHLSDFQELETETPVILTTSQLLTTGVDAPMVKNIAIARVVGSMTEFKQMIGRGTRLREDYGKLYFSILDYTGSASRHFADPDFDGEPEEIEEEPLPPEEPEPPREPPEPPEPPPEPPVPPEPPEPQPPRKYYVDGGSVEIAHELVSELDADGKKLRVIKYSDYTAEKVRTLYPTASDLRQQWTVGEKRDAVYETLRDRGIDCDELARQTHQEEADPFDLLCHVAFNAPLRTRRERAERVRTNRQDLFDKHGPEARGILEALLEKYAEHGLAEFRIPDVLKLPPISERGNVTEIIGFFGGADALRDAVNELQEALYAA